MSRLQRRPSRLVTALVVAVATVAALAVTTQAPAVAAPSTGAPALSDGVDGQVYATLVVGDTVYVGGEFTEAQSEAGATVDRTNLAAFDLGTGALIGSWRADVNGVVRSLATSGSHLYVGGGYTRIGGVAQARLARVSLSTGAVDTGFRPQLDSGVRAVQVDGDGVFAGGQFTLSDGVSHSYLVKLDATSGDTIASFAGAASGPVDALALSPDGTRLAVGGNFTNLSGANRTGLGMVDATTGNAVGPAFSFSVNPMLSLSWNDDGTALFGGSGNYNNLVARWNPTTGARGWSFNVGGDVQAIGYYDGTVYAGFHDNYDGDTHTKLLAADATSGVISSTFRPVFNQFWGVRSIAPGPWGLIIGGQFTAISGAWAHSWAIWPTARAVPTISVSIPAKATYGSQVNIGVTIPDSTGSVSVTGAGSEAVQTLTDGSATFALPRTLAAGEHRLTVAYSGDQQLAPSSTTRALTVTKAGTKVGTTVIRKATTRRVGKVKVTVASTGVGGETPSGKIKLRLTQGAKHRSAGTRPLQGKAVTFALPRLAAGSWRLVATYTGDVNHNAASHHRKLKVAKR